MNHGTAPTEPEPRRQVSRRSVLIGMAAGTAGLLVGRELIGPTPLPPLAAPADPVPVLAPGATQLGITRPVTPQTNGLFTSLDTEIASRVQIRSMLAELGAAITTVTDPHRALADITDDLLGDLTITVGLGPRLVSAVSTQLPGAIPLPRFARDGHLPSEARGGDLLLAVQATDAGLVDRVRDQLLGTLPDARIRWDQHGQRARGTGQPGVNRNALGYLDGIVVPRTAEDLNRHVWLTDGPARGGTICVLRRLRLEVARFTSHDETGQDAIIGRHRSDGSPLSGGGPMAQVDLHAKSPDGRYLTPARSHARAAHPSFTGSGTMLRGSYAYENGSERGMVFRSFQNDLDTFIRTQQRLDEVDELMDYARLTATASFLILPGFDANRPLGASLFVT